MPPEPEDRPPHATPTGAVMPEHAVPGPGLPEPEVPEPELPDAPWARVSAAFAVAAVAEPNLSARAPGPRVVITYCTQCRWLLRAAWYAQELLTTFHRELAEVALRPGTGGVFTVEIGETLVWDRSRDGGFPEIAPLKQRVRDLVAPDRPLGHVDKAQG